MNTVYIKDAIKTVEVSDKILPLYDVVNLSLYDYLLVNQDKLLQENSSRLISGARQSYANKIIEVFI